MPADGDDAAALNVSHELLPDAQEGHAVEVFLVANLDAAKVEAHDGWIVADEVANVAAPPLPLPVETVEGIVLMAGHVTALLKGSQTVGQSRGGIIDVHLLK